MSFSQPDIACSGTSWYVTPVTLPPSPSTSGFYTILYNTFSMTITQPTTGIILGITDNTYTSTLYPPADIFYYDNSKNSISSIAYKVSITSPNMCPTAGIYGVGNIGYTIKGKITLGTNGNIYSNDCGYFMIPKTTESGVINPIIGTTDAGKFTIVSLAKPTLPVGKSIPKNKWYTFSLRNGNVIWIDTNNNIISSPPGNGKQWFWDSNNNISTIINGKQLYWPDIPLQSLDINNDWSVISNFKLIDIPCTGWTLNQVDLSNPIWKFKPSNLNDTTTFFQNHKGSYLVFNFLNQLPTLSLYPYPGAIYDILSTINVVPVPFPPQPFPLYQSGTYYLQNQSRQCLTDSGIFDTCNYENSWYYDSYSGSLISIKSGNYLYNNLNPNTCEGDPNLLIGPWKTGHTKLAISHDNVTNSDRIFDQTCSICYDPSTMTISKTSITGQTTDNQSINFKFANVTYMKTDYSIVFIILAIITSILLFILLIRKR